MLKSRFNIQSFALHTAFRISRGVKTHIDVVWAVLEDECRNTGYGEAVPYARYGESAQGVLDQLKSFSEKLHQGFSRHDLCSVLPAGAARNAFDCALWDMEEDHDLPDYLPTAQTVVLGKPEDMANKAAEMKSDTLKIKLGTPGDMDALRAVHKRAPDKNIIVDANEGWSLEDLRSLLPQMKELGVCLIEQPLPAESDDGLRELDSPIPFYADESVHSVKDLPSLEGKYQGVNIKLDKSGGLTAAKTLKQEARAAGFDIMIGCMVCTSLSIRPALQLTDGVKWIDLDGAYWLKDDPYGPLIDFESYLKGSGFPVRKP